MPNSLDLVRKDHQSVLKLFQMYRERSGHENRRRIAQQAIEDIAVHSMLEARVLYPAARRHGLDDGLLDEAGREHGGIARLVDELRTLDPFGPAFDEKFRVLMQNVEQQLQWEESRVLPQVERLGQQVLLQLGEEMQQMKLQAREEAA